jgi:hypothetical protein
MGSYRIRNELKSEDEFQATYKGFSVSVKREGCPEDDYDDDGEDPASDYWTGPEDGQAFYIQVCNSEISFGTAYDGWWGNAENSLEEAVEEALRGSCLITDDQRKFPHLRGAT